MKKIAAVLVLLVAGCSGEPTAPASRQDASVPASCVVPAPKPGDVSIWACVTVSGHKAP